MESCEDYHLSLWHLSHTTPYDGHLKIIQYIVSESVYLDEELETYSWWELAGRMAVSIVQVQNINGTRPIQCRVVQHGMRKPVRVKRTAPFQLYKSSTQHDCKWMSKLTPQRSNSSGLTMGVHDRVVPIAILDWYWYWYHCWYQIIDHEARWLPGLSTWQLSASLPTAFLEVIFKPVHPLNVPSLNFALYRHM